jgi:hypothetical protein
MDPMKMVMGTPVPVGVFFGKADADLDRAIYHPWRGSRARIVAERELVWDDSHRVSKWRSTRVNCGAGIFRKIRCHCRSFCHWW